ncbi:DUF2610 domain-containing protein [Rickettsiales endosymbiont of Peranema trichophorum]|uniref:DUF2610 domain-containing protein n=1 Tax=Rickettsiales endosymbiont of Peranema trichophorum TaxID=2486577 RepID=UPI001023DDE0|nr:DUF2610 domain-containing protein [Rickettsiales endosymbiont of Peranema trichophorum]RZI47741.1 DUF2610 domain-containing protein [Rickettsiales endosymbiont of Peranema trichophorum]
MKKLTIPCDFHGVNAPFTVYIGNPEPAHHPLQFQSQWLSKERGGAIPQEFMESLQKIKEIADRNNVSFEELCTYALTASTTASTTASEAANAGGGGSIGDGK